MKNKLVKKNMTRFDYTARKLGIIGLFLIVITFSFALPIATSLANTNKTLAHEIMVIQENNVEDGNHQYNVKEGQ